LIFEKPIAKFILRPQFDLKGSTLPTTQVKILK